MWLVPHFVGMECHGSSSVMLQKRRVATIYQRQSNPVFDAAMLPHAQLRHGRGEPWSRPRGGPAAGDPRHPGAAPVFMSTLPDMDFGASDSAFLPFFGVPASHPAVARAHGRQSLKMMVQPMVVTDAAWGAVATVVQFPATLDRLPHW